MVRLSTFLPLGALAVPAHQALPLGFGFPSNDDHTYISVINATPYAWEKVYNHSYQAVKWDASWPATIKPGDSVQMLAGSRPLTGTHDTAGEVRYRLRGTRRPAAFQVEFRGRWPANVTVRFMDELETLDGAKGSVHRLGFLRYPAGVGFVLAGIEGGFISNDPPFGWMQAMLPDIGRLSLRQVTLPRAHHAGMWKPVAPIGAGAPSNTLTQHDELRHQLRNDGVRVLDVRATWWHKSFRESHKSKVGIFGWQGMYGAGVEEMIDIVNLFNDEVPGELIVFDMHADARTASRNMKPLNDVEMDKLWALLKRLKHRVSVPDGEDVTRWPLERFIANRTSAVLIRVANSWTGPRSRFPGGREGFFNETTFPSATRWSNTNNHTQMIQDQIVYLRRNRPSRNSPVWNVDWFLTQQKEEVLYLARGIMDLGMPTWRSLYHELWNALTDQTYPNWLSMDGIYGSQLKTFVMAINHCLAARKCGSLGGKVNASEIVDRHNRPS